MCRRNIGKKNVVIQTDVSIVRQITFFFHKLSSPYYFSFSNWKWLLMFDERSNLAGIHVQMKFTLLANTIRYLHYLGLLFHFFHSLLCQFQISNTTITKKKKRKKKESKKEIQLKILRFSFLLHFFLFSNNHIHLDYIKTGRLSIYLFLNRNVPHHTLWKMIILMCYLIDHLFAYIKIQTNLLYIIKVQAL